MRWLSPRSRAAGLSLAVMASLAAGCDDGGDPPVAPADAGGDGALDATTLDGGAVDQRVVDATIDAQPADARAPDGAVDADVPVDAAPADMAPDQGLLPCDPPLQITPDVAFVAAFDGVDFSAEGGTGRWRFTLVDNPSGAILNPLTGAYIGGANLGVADTIRLSDTGCIGSAEAVAHVVDPLELRPAAAEVGIGVAFEFDTLGGSGEVEFELVESGSGGAIDGAGRYQAGDAPGTDRVRVRDPLTGLSAEAVLTVVEAPVLRIDPPRLFMTNGSETTITPIGGSGHLELMPAGDAAVALDAQARMIRAVAPGRARVAVRDRYTGVEAPLVIDVADPIAIEQRRSGRSLRSAHILAPGDLDADGFADAILAHPGAHVGGYARGAALVYRGGPLGLDPTPAQVIAGTFRDDEAGRGAALGDLDGDGRLDLLLGIWADDERTTNAGALRVWPGIEDGWFADAPAQSVFGPLRDDRMGASVAVCDFNGDDWPDVAVDVHNYNAPEGGAANQGGVMVFLGGPDGLTAEPDGGIALGRRLDADGVLQPQRDMRLGFTIAAGDVNGDALCDLVVHDQGWVSGGGRRSDGAIQVFLGREAGTLPVENDPGGIETDPVRIIGGDAPDVREGELGRRLMVADLNADGRADIIASQHGWDGEGNQRGAVRVFAGGPLLGPVETVTPVAEAAWTVTGLAQGDAFGFGLDVADWDGDGHLDVLVGAANGEAPPPEGEQAIVNTGAVYLYRGAADGWPALEPEILAAGEAPGDHFGDAVKVIGDANGDAVADLMVFAELNDSLGPDVGRPYFVDGASGERIALELPGAPAASQLSRGLSVEADGWLVGAPEHAVPPQRNGGTVWWAAPGEAPTPIEGHHGHSGSDRFGLAVTRGDFDGDGRADLIIAAPTDELPGNRPETWQLEGDCGGGNDKGLVYVYRGGAVRPDTPDFVLVGDQAGAQFGQSLAVADVNGDGRDDVIAGGHVADGEGLNDQGGVIVFAGVEADPAGGTRVLCTPLTSWRSGLAGARAGFALAALGDITDDGCAEVAIGAFNARVDEVTGGAVFIMRGFGGVGCPAQPAFAGLSPRAGGAQFGVALAAGDLVTDPRADLVIGAAEIVDPDSRQRRGAVFLIDAADLAGLPFDGTVQAVPEASRVIYGRLDVSDFGRSVAVADDVIVVGQPFNGVSDARSFDAGAELVAFGAAGLERIGAVVGETASRDARLGFSVAASRDGRVALIGALFGAGDAGAAWRFALDDLPGRAR